MKQYWSDKWGDKMIEVTDSCEVLLIEKEHDPQREVIDFKERTFGRFPNNEQAVEFAQKEARRLNLSKHWG